MKPGGKFIIYFTFVVSLLIIVHLREIANIDFNKAYYPVAKSILEKGTFIYEYDGLKNLPLVGVFLVPFALFKLHIAQHVFLFFELLCYTLSFIVFSEFLTRTYKERWILLFLFLTCRSFYIAIFFGQLTPLAFFLLLCMIILYLKRKGTWSGDFLTSLFLVKIPPGLFWFYFLKKKEYQILKKSVLTYGIFVAISVLVFGWSLHEEWFQFVIKLNVGTTLPGYNNQTLSAFLFRYLNEFDPYDWDPSALHPLFHLFLLLWIAGTTVWFIMRMSAKADDVEAIKLELSIMICLFLGAFPLVWDHYYMFLIFPLFIVLEQIRKRGTWIHYVILMISFIMLNPPVGIFFNPQTSFRLLNATLMSLPFIGCGVLLFLLEWLRTSHMKKRQHVTAKTMKLATA
jgi:hypothetical protein